MKNIVVGLGEILWDLLPEGKKLGGAPANFAYHVSQCGLDSCVVSAVGDDDLGHEAVRILESKGLNRVIEQVPYPTGAVEIKLSDKGVPVYEFRNNTAWDNIPFTTQIEILARRTYAVCFGSLAQRSEVSRRTIARFLDVVTESNGRYIIFDMNLRENYYTEDILRQSISRCNILKINDEEFGIISGMFGYVQKDLSVRCRAMLHDFDLEILVLTCGENGSYVFAHGEESFMPVATVTVADTVGAGDSFTAAFISAILKGKTIRDAHRMAVDVSGFVCSKSGAMPELPDEYRLLS